MTNAATLRRAVLIPPHRRNIIHKAAMHIASTMKTARPEPIETTGSAHNPVPTASNDETKPVAAHFAGLLAPVNRSAMTGSAEEEAETDGDEEGGDGGRIGDRGLLGLVVAKRLIAARLLNGYSQSEAATVVGYGSPAQLSLWEAGKRRPPLAALVQYADVMGVSLDYIFGRSDDPERNVRLVRQNACVRAVRATLIGAVERIVDAFDSDESIVGLNIGLVGDLAAAAESVAATHGDLVQSQRLGRGNVAERLATAVARLEGAALKVGIALRRHDDEDARTRQRLAEIAANDAG